MEVCPINDEGFFARGVGKPLRINYYASVRHVSVIGSGYVDLTIVACLAHKSVRHVSVIGSGYVDLTIVACLAHKLGDKQSVSSPEDR
jgi:UDP-N-acetyl-D-mannosaminuronate dehydrogenase